MRIALITDIHANKEALDAVLLAMRRDWPDQVIILGDIVGYGPDPVTVIEAVQDLQAGGAIVLKGNHDEAVNLPRNSMNEMARDAIKWTKTQLTPSHLEWLDGLPLTHRDGDCLFVHASAHEPAIWHYVNSPDAAAASIRATDARFTFCGHTHRPAHWHLSPSGAAQHFSPVTDVALPLSLSRRSVTVIGACGQPRDGRQAACYALLDTSLRQITMRRAPYNPEETLRKIKAAGLPAWLGSRLLLGQ
ncbi:MAG: metallophosphoesterase family protein [Rhizobiaceae bacterium]|jgi:diadenosine tetraphosphatase ApaH/serine/threonine PP2A family protein phosphatase|nr:metallophosphoesterase family protein [Rhizobiaceae bacterium]